MSDDLNTLSPRQRAALENILRGSAQQRTADRIRPRAPNNAMPLSTEQRHVWYHGAIAANLPLYNESITIHRFGAFSLDALERALAEIIRRHEIWRTSFELRNGQPVTVVHPPFPLKLDVVDLSGLEPAECERRAIELAAADTRKPIDVGRAPLLRATVVRLGAAYHRLYLTLHHIIFDGVTIYRIFLPELGALYDDYAYGRPASLREPELQYGDYVTWREQQGHKQDRARELAYWREQLAGPLPQLALPSDRKPLSNRTFGGSMEVFALSRELTADLKGLSRREGTTLYITLLTAFKALLHRYTAQSDIILGGVTDTRRRPELENVMGYFLNTIPLRTRPQSTTRFCDYLHAVERTVVEALDASDIPFDELVRELRIKREPGRHPLFQVLFSMEPPRPDFPPGWSLTQMDVTVGTAKFDLYLELDEDDGRIIARFLYSTELFKAQTIRRMIGHWTSLLEGVARDATLSLAALPLLTADEKASQARRNATSRSYSTAPVVTLFEQQAYRTPDAIAVERNGESLSYAALDRRAAAIAAQLRRRGISRGDLVAIAMERSCEMVAALLGIMKAGAAYLPLDPALPDRRLDFLIADARPAMVLIDGFTDERFRAASLPRLMVGRSASDTPGTSETQAATAAPDDLAYVLYTSGSTAKPKPVAIRHSAVTNVLLAVKDEIGLVPSDRLLAVTTISFDIAALELFMPLIMGARVILASRQDATDPLRLAHLLKSTAASAMQATPATWRGLLATGWPGRPQLKVLCGGEALSPDLAAALRARCASLWNVYGPTETTIWSLIHRIAPGDDPVPIGRPLANTRLYIVDQNDQPVPDLVTGELLIAGAGLAFGYRNEPSLTQQKFVELPAIPGERLYRTGDIARFRSDGVVEYLGRVDHQVKIRGFRVGTEEVEAALLLHPRIAACAATTVQDASGEASLIAFVVTDRLEAAEIAELRNFLRQQVPEYMVPAQFLRVATLPMTANGKIDRKSLPVSPVRSVAPAVAAPRDDIERQLTEIWKQVLGVAEIGIDDDFFDLGGHSLLAAALVGRIGEAFGQTLPLSAIFEAPIIAGLADRLRSGSRPAFSYTVPLKATGRGNPLFIVHGIFGNVLQLRRLVEQLRTPRAIYALQARGADPDQRPHENIAAMVDAYEVAIREVQPRGPYALSGYSFGGLVAYELARRFRARGDQVEFLGLFETDLYARFLPLKNKLLYLASLARRVLVKTCAIQPGAIPSYLASKIAQLGHRVMLRAGMREDFDDLGDIPGPMAVRNREMYSIGVRAFTQFNPRPYDGKLTVFRVAGPRFGTCDPLPIWRRTATGIEIFDIEGSHGTIMEPPHVEDLAIKLGACLERLDGQLKPLPQRTAEPVRSLDPLGLVTRLDAIGG